LNLRPLVSQTALNHSHLPTEARELLPRTLPRRAFAENRLQECWSKYLICLSGVRANRDTLGDFRQCQPRLPVAAVAGSMCEPNVERPTKRPTRPSPQKFKLLKSFADMKPNNWFGPARERQPIKRPLISNDFSAKMANGQGRFATLCPLVRDSKRRVVFGAFRTTSYRRKSIFQCVSLPQSN
jgi:hypothetical protein